LDPQGRLNDQRDPVTRLPSRQWNVLEAVQQQAWWVQVIGERVNAFGATNVLGEVLAPPGVEADDEEELLLDCKPEDGEQPDPEAPLQSAAGVAALLDRESDQVSEVRCIEADRSDGYDVICTYFDARMGERMKTGYRWGPNSTISGGGAVPADMALPAS
jgi:hypothetical protein